MSQIKSQISSNLDISTCSNSNRFELYRRFYEYTDLKNENEKILLDRAKNKTLSNFHEYSKELDKITKPLQTRKIKVKEA